MNCMHLAKEYFTVRHKRTVAVSECERDRLERMEADLLVKLRKCLASN